MRLFFALEVMETVCSKKRRKKRTKGNQIFKRTFLPNTEQGKSIGQVIMTAQVFSKDILAKIPDTGDFDECWTLSRIHIEHEAMVWDGVCEYSRYI